MPKLKVTADQMLSRNGRFKEGSFFSRSRSVSSMARKALGDVNAYAAKYQLITGSVMNGKMILQLAQCAIRRMYLLLHSQLAALAFLCDPISKFIGCLRNKYRCEIKKEATRKKGLTSCPPPYEPVYSVGKTPRRPWAGRCGVPINL